MEVFCMCGIVGYVGKRSAQDVLLDGLEKLEYRGYDSAGVALALDGGIRVVKSKGRLTQLRQKLAAQALAQSFCGIGHTRWATHGEPSDVNSHPHSTPRVSIVHNGIIENYGILKERLIAKGDTFESETDTEVLVKLIDSCYTGDPLRALQEALAKVRGSYALAVLFRDRPDTIFAVKRESPLIVGWGEGENFVASDIPALLKYTRRYSVLEESKSAIHIDVSCKNADTGAAPGADGGLGYGGSRKGRLPALHAQGDQRAADGHHGYGQSPRGGRHAGPAHPAAHR